MSQPESHLGALPRLVYLRCIDSLNLGSLSDMTNFPNCKLLERCCLVRYMTSPFIVYLYWYGHDELLTFRCKITPTRHA